MSEKLIGLVSHPDKKGVAALAVALRNEFAKSNVRLKMDHASAAVLGEHDGSSIADLARECELLVVLGGDGTILSTAHALGDQPCPLFGINLGTLGFLTCMGPADYRQAVRCIVEGNYQLSQRAILHVEVVRAGEVIDVHLGLNDAVISRGALSRLIQLETKVNGSLLTRYNGDGLIVATPTGSTAYSLSAGGPLLTPDSEAFAITPICPHTLTNRSVIVADKAVVEVRIVNQHSEIYLTVDGQQAIGMRTLDSVRIRKAVQTLPLAMLPHLPFFELVRRRLKWSGSNV